MKKPILLLTSAMLAITVAAAGDGRNACPLSFTYDGEAFSARTWPSSERMVAPGETETLFTSPDGKLRLSVIRKTYPDFPVTELRSTLECISSEETGIIDDFRSFVFSRKYDSRSIKVRRITGSESKYTDFCRHDVLLQQRPGCDTLSLVSGTGLSASSSI